MVQVSCTQLSSILGFVCVLQTVTSSLYLAVVSTHIAVRRFRSPVRRSGTRCLTSSEIRRRVVLIVLSSFLRQSCSGFTNVTSALEVFLNVMRYINPRFRETETFKRNLKTFLFCTSYNIPTPTLSPAD